MDQNINETQEVNSTVSTDAPENQLKLLNKEVQQLTNLTRASNKLHIIIGSIIIVMLAVIIIFIVSSNSRCNEPYDFGSLHQLDKPVIYLYPEETSNIDVYLSCDNMTTMWPKANLVDDNKYHWHVTADPDGTLHQDTYDYSYLFWEARTSNLDTTFDRGFCVSGEETGEFLRIVLNEMGLTPEEYNDFIVYWLPKMEHNKYNLITFSGIDTTDEYNRTYPLSVVDENGNTPDCMMRVFMSWKAVDEPVEIEPQTFTTLRRHGFTVIEWGGTEIKE